MIQTLRTLLFSNLFSYLFIFVCSLSPSVFAEAFISEKKFQLIIDPGHGGNDIGALQNKIKESELVLILAKKIEILVHQKDPAISVRLTRSQNQYVNLEDRVQNEASDLFLSLHANSSISNKVEGMEIYFQPDQKIKSTTTVEAIIEDLESMGKTQRSLEFSKILQSHWSISSSVLRRSAFFVIEKAKSTAVLVEVGFLTNFAEAQKLATDEYQNQIAESIVKAILDYKLDSKNSVQ